MRRHAVFLGLFLVLLALPGVCTGSSLKPVILDDSYNHEKYAPENKGSDPIFKFRAYVACFDGADDDNGDGSEDKWGIPQWVAYQIKKYDGVLGKGPKRPASWITDDELHSHGIAPSNDTYKFSRKYRKENPNSPQLGYDRGHMCMKQHAWRLGANADWNTHTVLNACPQKAKLNQGIWLDLEKKTASWADKYGSVWIIVGPIIYNKRVSKWLGEEGEVKAAIPDAFFKIVIAEQNGKIQVLAFIYPQENNYSRKKPYNHVPYLTSIDEIETLTGLDFMPALDDELESELERSVSAKLWD